MHRRLLSEDDVKHLPPCTSASQHGLMNFGFHDFGQFAQVLECRLELGTIIDIGVTSHEFADAAHHRAQLGQMGDRAMSTFGQIDDILTVEQTFDKAVQFLKTYQPVVPEIGGSRIHRYAGQPEWVAALLVLSQAIPKAIDQSSDQFVSFVHVMGWTPPVFRAP